jgi:4-hydroxy-3-polyprenylbenzoate decarboxylase
MERTDTRPTHDLPQRTITVGMSGASGMRYGMRLLEQLLRHDCRLLVMISRAARAVFAAEEGGVLPEDPAALGSFLQARFAVERPGHLTVFDDGDWHAPVASGSAAPRQMVVCPCSTGMLSAIAHGASDTLMERAADVVLKEGGRLVLVPREMPLSSIHLENMLALSRMGVVIMPASPGFYLRPQTIDDLVNMVVGRILDQLGIDNTLSPPWGAAG